MKLPTNIHAIFIFLDSQSTVNSQQSTITDGATGLNIKFRCALADRQKMRSPAESLERNQKGDRIPKTH
ncbi:hypothetical protein QUB75_22435 [Microcoleus sp. K1-B6]|uniref:hypothetical protein n=1 Tax=unclassified Microcoleus TaxID=2642155 RepID=UPI002FD13349